MNEGEPISAGQAKVNEYVDKIKKGEADLDSTLKGLGPHMQQAIRAGLGISEVPVEGQETNEAKEAIEAPAEAVPDPKDYLVTEKQQTPESVARQQKTEAKLADVRESLGIPQTQPEAPASAAPESKPETKEGGIENLGSALDARIDEVSQKISSLTLAISRSTSINNPDVVSLRNEVFESAMGAQEIIDQMLPTLREAYSKDIAIPTWLGHIKTALEALKTQGASRELARYDLNSRGPGDSFKNLEKSFSAGARMISKKFKEAQAK